jgi:hypothetical protein
LVTGEGDSKRRLYSDDEDVIEGSPVVQALLTFMDQREWWSGTAS